MESVMDNLCKCGLMKVDSLDDLRLGGIKMSCRRCGGDECGSNAGGSSMCNNSEENKKEKIIKKLK